ncbi:MAG TPA: RNA polymerase sigma factor [Bryobacteraceae bacterium]|nr:RNA polymerase sigma factor [Bryobacteraceae bacterium]
MDHQAESQLARSLMAGEPEAFDRFVAHFRSKVFHYSWLMCGSPEDAEEVAQETLLKVFGSIDQLRDPDHVRAWVFRIARNACLMQRRKSVFAPTQEVSLDDVLPSGETADVSETPDRTLLSGELRAVLDRVIMELPPPYRAVVVLRDLEELSTEETAEILAIKPDAVKTRLHRARAAMRQTLDCYLNNHCLEDQPSPNPTPLTAEERAALHSEWHKKTAAPKSGR